MSISYRKINAIFTKQLKNCFKNLNIASTALVVPLMTFVFFRIIPANNATAFILGSFSVLNMSMIGTLMMTYLISEEKEKNTLRVLMTSTVSPIEFLIGNGLATWIVTMITSIVVLLTSGVRHHIIAILFITALSAVAAIILGAVIGLLSKNQMSASVISLPFIIAIMMLPILGTFNATMHEIAKILFTQQLNLAFVNIESNPISISGILIILANIAVFTIVFIVLYRYRRLDE